MFAVLTFGTLRRVRSRRKVVRSMSHSDPAIRSSSIIAAERHGLSWYVDALADRALVEENPEVRSVLAEALVRNPWEPGADPRRALLDRWAHRTLEVLTAEAGGVAEAHKEDFSLAAASPPPEQVFSEADTTVPVAGVAGTETAPPAIEHDPLADPAGPLGSPSDLSQAAALAGGTSVISEPLLDPFGEARFAPPQEFNDVPAAFSTGFSTGSVVSGSSHGERSVVLVTGAGSSVGMVMIRALGSIGYRVVAADSDPLATGLHMAHDFGVLPAANDRRFLPELLNLADRSGARILIPTVVEELFSLSAAQEYLRNIFGLSVWLPSQDAIIPCWDRWSFVEKGREAGLSIPASGLGTVNGVEGPWVVKSRYARGSNNVRSVDDLGELEFVMARTTEPIIQHRLAGREFTVDALAVSNGEMLGAVLQSRLGTTSSGSSAFETFSDNEVTKQVSRLVGVFGLEGPVKVQGFITDDGKVSLFGVKPTFSSGLSLSIAAGADLVGEYVHAIEGMPPRPDRLTFQPGVRMFRSFADIFER